jgi:cytochrome b
MMKAIQLIRGYHAALAVSSILAYLTGELGLIHAWLGYGVAVIIALRLVLALTGVRQLGLEKFYPSFEGLKIGNALTHPMVSRALLFGIATSLILTVLTGIFMDGGKAIGLADANLMVGSAYADDGYEHGRQGHHAENEFLEEGHEFFANLMLLFVGAHVAYLFLFKLPLAKFMLFMNK